jgi:hypothetical protein
MGVLPYNDAVVKLVSFAVLHVATYIHTPLRNYARYSTLAPYELSLSTYLLIMQFGGDYRLPPHLSLQDVLNAVGGSLPPGAGGASGAAAYVFGPGGVDAWPSFGRPQSSPSPSRPGAPWAAPRRAGPGVPSVR